MVLRREGIPFWVWALLGITSVLVIAVVISVASMTQAKYTAVVPEPQVPTGRPQDFMQQPPPTPATPGTPVTPTTTSPSPGMTPPQPATSGAAGGGPNGSQPSSPASVQALPKTIQFGGDTWSPAGGPVDVDVVTTGQYADDHIIYAKPGDQPPYKGLYLETAPNSGQFYRYDRARV